LYNRFRIFKIGLRYSFICQGTSTRRQRRDLFGFRVKLPPVRHNKRTCRPIFTLSLIYAKRQAGSCEYQI